jgi:hypothetical protein
MRSKSLIIAVFLSVLISSLQAQTNYSLSFDGSNDYLDVSDNSTLRFTTALSLINAGLKNPAQLHQGHPIDN